LTLATFSSEPAEPLVVDEAPLIPAVTADRIFSDSTNSSVVTLNSEDGYSLAANETDDTAADEAFAEWDELVLVL
jgi:hypothetical protein